MSIRITSQPSIEPVSRDEAKTHVRYEDSDCDDEIELLVQAARQQIEQWEWRSHITQTIELTLDLFPSDVIYVPRPPLQSVTQIQYVDSDGETQTLDAADYQVDTASEPGRIKPAYGEAWPSTRDQLAAVTVTYKAGYGDDAADVPERTKHAIKLLLGHLWRNREAVGAGRLTEVPLTIGALLSPCHDERVLEFLK